ncbi:hypothetical protein DMH12_15280 [Streptomyces sp. WAC 04229]|uniref:hypothetical protein n=1 Tax=Streptomyces sp. WAC 04229 TaxID=2203206 RepID=UPI000F74B5F2|nr:hypothetical protein [Streptomyces sp. WAC 04229]RSN55579.1 hypothetical protein DMH12_15280 [Streptomyces sp. WAC 04229]
MTAQGGAASARVWEVTVSCPRPKPRIPAQRQAWHLEPERAKRSIQVFFPRGTSLTFTARTVRLRTSLSEAQLTGWYAPHNVERMLAELLHGMYFDTELSGASGLPHPVRFNIVKRIDQTPPIEGDQVT